MHSSFTASLPNLQKCSWKAKYISPSLTSISQHHGFSSIRSEGGSDPFHCLVPTLILATVFMWEVLSLVLSSLSSNPNSNVQSLPVLTVVWDAECSSRILKDFYAHTSQYSIFIFLVVIQMFPHSCPPFPFCLLETENGKCTEEQYEKISHLHYFQFSVVNWNHHPDNPKKTQIFYFEHRMT